MVVQLLLGLGPNGPRPFDGMVLSAGRGGDGVDVDDVPHVLRGDAGIDPQASRLLLAIS